MADSDILVTGLTASGGAQQIVIDLALQDLSPLPLLRVAAIEIWAATSNNRASASKVGETGGLQFVHSGLGTLETWYYWALARDGYGNTGDWYPVSDTGGVSAATTSTELADGSVTNAKLAGGITYDKISISSLSALTATLGTVTSGTITSGTFQTAGSGRRVTITASDNYLRVYDSGGAQVGAFGNGYSGDTTLYISKASVSAAIFVSNTSTGYALQATGHALISNSQSGYVGLQVGNSLNAGSNHAIRGHNTGGGGGSALLGVSGTSGGYGVYAETGGYGPFTGQHDGFLPMAAKGGPGDIVIDTGRILARSGIDDAVGVNALAAIRGDPRVFGVISKRVPFALDALLGAFGGYEGGGGAALRRFVLARYDRVVVNSVGEGLINVCGRGGNIEAGDLICASYMPGKGQRQADDVMRACTVAKAREAVFFKDPNEVKRIACTYHCG